MFSYHKNAKSMHGEGGGGGGRERGLVSTPMYYGVCGQTHNTIDVDF